MFKRLMAHVVVRENHKIDVKNRMMQPGRLYHAVQHLVTMWQLHEGMRKDFAASSAATVPGGNHLLASAIAYHDAVYDARSKTNEQDSAGLWMLHTKDDKPLKVREWVRQAIEATADHLADRPLDTPEDHLREWFVGLDLAALAAPWDIFLRNNRLIRWEYEHLSDTEFTVTQTAFLTGLLNQPRIYRDDILHANFETAARQNISQYLC